ncbi:Mbov_0121 family peptidase domain-containing ABC transporter [Mycoplasma phocimorsus]|uniref:Mbov_0121 family peptidase domain-containing ABC transporter n=1 Tax=Mycoplasma phocimorsus TaxID=3045839 RepID=UPI0024C058A0|nr:cysteine peptidase family C39 domain-containing protein [Mycoplasma phocimorsus]MDJ1649163.1 cysteine peptidase family C39 domain-containing protein [Mycoplasma phocimorsus]
MQKQIDLKDCGLFAIAYLYKYYEKNNLEINELKMKAKYDVEGINLLELQYIAKEYGIFLESYEGSYEAFLKLKIEKPFICVIKNNEIYHYVIIIKKHKNILSIFDPAKGKIKMSIEEFKKIYLNIIITATYKKVIKNNTNYQKTNKIFVPNMLMLLLIPSLLLLLISNFIMNGFIKIILDFFALNKNNYIFIIFIVSYLFLIIIHGLNKFFYSLITKFIELKIAKNIWQEISKKIASSYSIYIRKLTKEDYIRRYSVIFEVASFQSKYIYTLIYEAIVLISSILLLIYFEYKLSIIAFITSILICIISIFFQNLKNKKYEEILKQTLENNYKSIDFIFNINNLKRNENLLIDWEKSNKKLIIQNFNYYKYEQLNLMINIIISLIAPILIVSFSLENIYNKTLGVGTLVLFLNLFNYLNNSSIYFSGFISNYKKYKINIEMLNFIMNFKTEKDNDNGFEIDNIENIEVQNLNFEYSKGHNVLNIKKFKTTKNFNIKGNNGSGKSTLLSIFALDEKVENVLRINNIDINQFNKRRFRNELILLNSNIILPTTSIISYLTKGNYLLKKELFENIKKYNLLFVFNEMNFNINSSMINAGSNMSKGQQDLVKILNLFCKKYKLILLDEIFENLDKKNFEYLKFAIKDYQCNAFFIEISHNNNYIYEEETLEI